MTHPHLVVTVDGVPVSGVFFDRLISLTITDREGIRSDTLDLVFDDAPPHFHSPRRGAKVGVTVLNGSGSVFIGSYIIDRVEFSCIPHTISVKGHSADLRSEMKANKTRHWDNVSIKDIVDEKARDYELKSKVSKAVSSHVYEWIGQQDESDLNFLERLARRHGALFTIKNGILLWLERGVGKSADGTAIPPSLIPKSTILEATCRVSETDVDRFAKVKAYWQDRKNAKRQEVTVEADPNASGDHVLRDPYSSKEEAESAAKAAAQEMLRGLIETSCGVIGRPSLMAGQPVIYVGVRPIVDGHTFVLETVTHSFTKSGGLRTTFTGKLKTE